MKLGLTLTFRVERTKHGYILPQNILLLEAEKTIFPTVSLPCCPWHLGELCPECGIYQASQSSADIWEGK